MPLMPRVYLQVFILNEIELLAGRTGKRKDLLLFVLSNDALNRIYCLFVVISYATLLVLFDYK